MGRKGPTEHLATLRGRLRGTTRGRGRHPVVVQEVLATEAAQLPRQSLETLLVFELLRRLLGTKTAESGEWGSDGSVFSVGDGWKYLKPHETVPGPGRGPSLGRSEWPPIG